MSRRNKRHRHGEILDSVRRPDIDTRPSNIVPGDSTVYFGRWNMDGRLLNGDLDDIAIWSRALTPGEISTLTTHPPSHPAATR